MINRGSIIKIPAKVDNMTCQIMRLYSFIKSNFQSISVWPNQETRISFQCIFRSPYLLHIGSCAPMPSQLLCHQVYQFYLPNSFQIHFSFFTLTVLFYLLKKNFPGPDMIAYTCNTNYPGSRDWEDHSTRPAWAKSLRDLFSANKSCMWWHVPVIPGIGES
jgi:hypothetical protein